MLKAEKPSIEILRTPPLRAVSTTEMEARFKLVNAGGTPVTIEPKDAGGRGRSLQGQAPGGGRPGETAKFLILAKDHKEEIRGETEIQDSPLVVERFGEGEVDRPIRFDVHLKAGQGGSGEVHNVVIRRGGTSAEPIKVPISIR